MIILHSDHNPVKKNFVFTYKGQAVGYIGYTVFDKEQNIYSGGSYIGEPKKCPVSAGAYLAFTANEYAYMKLGYEKMCTEVFADNKKAVKLNKLLGWKPNHDYDYYVMKDGNKKLVFKGFCVKEDWENVRTELSDLLSGDDG